MDFLDKIFWNNTIRSYLVVMALISVALILKRFMSRRLAVLIYNSCIKKIWKTVSKSSFTGLVIQPLEWFIVIVVSVFAIDKLNFPSAFEFTLYGHPIADILSRTGTAIIIVSFIFLSLRLMDFIAMILEEKADKTEDVRDNQLIVFFRDFLKVIIGIIGILLIIKACFNQPLGNLLTGLSIVGAALALGAKESLENLIASFIIFFDKPFFAGDTVKVNNVSGSIEKIGLRSTRIRTADKTLVTVPNKQMVDTMVDNWSMRTGRRAEIKLELSINTNLATIEMLLKALKEMLENNKEHISSNSVFLKELSKNGITIIVEYFTLPFSAAEFDTVKQSFNLQVKKLLEENQIEFSGQTGKMIINTVEEKEA
ncbi:MAG: mechanosensitive ion channel family protein [Ferruginibacter sp.]